MKQEQNKLQILKHIHLSPGVKQQGRETDHSPPASAKVKKMWFYTSIPPYAFMA
jgi:hypothetical protein